MARKHRSGDSTGLDDSLDIGVVMDDDKIPKRHASHTAPFVWTRELALSGKLESLGVRVSESHLASHRKGKGGIHTVIVDGAPAVVHACGR